MRRLLSLYETKCISCDRELLVGRDQEDLDLRIVCRDQSLLTAYVVALRIDLCADEAEVLIDDDLTGKLVVLADTSGEGDGIYTVHSCSVCTDVLRYSVTECVFLRKMRVSSSA